MSDRNPLDELDADVNHLNELFPGAPTEFGTPTDYYYIQDLNSNFTVAGDDFSLIHLNIRSLNCNGDAFSAVVDQLNFRFDVMCFTESWLNPYTSGLVNFNSYKPLL